jgi:type I restriction enzyme R subunit
MADPDRQKRYLDQVLALIKAFALAGSRPEAVAISDDVRLFGDVRAAILKLLAPEAGSGGISRGDVDTAIGQLVNEAVTADEVLDIYALAGVKAPEMSILSDEFLDNLATKERPNLQLGLLRRLLADKITTISRTNIVQSRKFSEALTDAIRNYTNRSLTTAEIITELVDLAKEMRNQEGRHHQLGLSEVEAAFYDAVVQNQSAVLQLGDAKLKKISVDLVYQVRNSVTIDWNAKESIKAGLRSKVRRLLAINGYPPDLEEKAVELVLEQAELLADTSTT